MRQLPCDIASFIPTKPYLKYGYKYIDYFRNYLFKIAFKKTGREFYIRSFATFHNPQNFSIGNNSLVGARSRIFCDDSVVLGDNILIGPELIIFTSDHVFNDKNKLIVDQGYSTAPVTIEDDVYIGARVIILPGVKISKGAVVGAGAIVNKDIPEYAIAVGTPAKVVSYRT
jgi:maltose O-acetyltransferase